MLINRRFFEYAHLQVPDQCVNRPVSLRNTHLFLYTKVKSAPFFRDLGFYEIARVDETMVFMENRKNGFAEYLKKLARKKQTEKMPPLL